MASEETLALARSYLVRHQVPDNQFGLGPLLEHGVYRLYASPRAMLDGSMLLQMPNGVFKDCRSLSLGLYDDILANNPELHPRVMTYSDTARGVHNWVEITDPKTGETIQIDSTPWYATLNPGHVGVDGKPDERSNVVPLSMAGGVPLSVKVTGTSTISVYLHGLLPKVSVEEKIKREVAKLEGDSDDLEPAEYRFILLAALAPHFGDEPEKTLCVYVDVLDSAQLQHLIGASLDDLVEADVLDIGIDFPGLTDLSAPLFLMRQIAEQSGKSSLLAEIERGLVGIMRLLTQTTPQLDVYGNDTSYIDITSGKPMNRLPPTRKEILLSYETPLAERRPTNELNLGKYLDRFIPRSENSLPGRYPDPEDLSTISIQPRLDEFDTGRYQDFIHSFGLPLNPKPGFGSRRDDQLIPVKLRFIRN